MSWAVRLAVFSVTLLVAASSRGQEGSVVEPAAGGAPDAAPPDAALPDVIVIDDDAPGAADPGAPVDDVIVIDDDDDDSIIIIDDGEDDVDPDAPERPKPITGALGRLWETWHVAVDSDLMAGLQWVDPQDGAWRVLGSAWLETWLLPADNLSFYATAFGRVAIDGTPTGTIAPFADVYEAYAKVNIYRATAHVGRIVVPWGRTQLAALGDRLNPPDLRRGPAFPDAGRQRQPQFGGSLRTSLGPLGLEAVGFGIYDPSEGSLAASQQGGVRVARYQTALVRSPARAGGLFALDDTVDLREPSQLIATASGGVRASRRVGDLDFAGSLVFGFDETPTLSLSPEMALFLAGDAFEAQGRPKDSLAALPCATASVDCVGGPGTLTHQRTTSLSLDASWGLGLIIVRGEVIAFPNFQGPFSGRTALTVGEAGIQSRRTGGYGAAVAIEGQLASFVDGSLEIFDVWWNSVPAGERLWGVELLDSDATEERTVHRLAAGAALQGAFLDDRLRWRFRGEAGLLQPDVLMSAELRYRLPVLGLYVGGRTDLYTGLAGSPGWMRQDSSMLGVFVGEGT